MSCGGTGRCGITRQIRQRRLRHVYAARRLDGERPVWDHKRCARGAERDPLMMPPDVRFGPGGSHGARLDHDPSEDQ